MTVIWSAVSLLTVWTPVSVSVNLEVQGVAVTPVYLDTPGEEVEPAAQVQKASVQYTPQVSGMLMMINNQ